MKKILFILRNLPRNDISIQKLFSGYEALSGTHSTTLMIAEGLARRGWASAVHIVNGGKIHHSEVKNFDNLDKAASWISNETVIWSYNGDNKILNSLNRAGLLPIVWSHIHVPKEVRSWLLSGVIRGLLTVSDTARLPFLRSKYHSRIGRVYNPLSPVFGAVGDRVIGSNNAHEIVFTGYMNVSKGAHRLMQLWPCIRRLEPKANLILAGSERLYGSERDVGPSGLSSPAFEMKYLAPIIAEFGSLEKAGIITAGLLPPVELKRIYLKCRLGIVNLNLHDFTETFCCTATEMLASGLPVFGVARGALPETIGLSGGAYLSDQENLQNSAQEFVDLYNDKMRLLRMGEDGIFYAKQYYSLDHVLNKWEQLLDAPDRLEEKTGDWRGPRTKRFLVEKWTGKLRLEKVLNLAVNTVRLIRLTARQ